MTRASGRLVACPVPHCTERKGATVLFCWRCTDLAGAGAMEELGCMERALAKAPPGERRVEAVLAYNARIAEIVRRIDARLGAAP